MATNSASPGAITNLQFNFLAVHLSSSLNTVHYTLILYFFSLQVGAIANSSEYRLGVKKNSDVVGKVIEWNIFDNDNQQTKWITSPH